MSGVENVFDLDAFGLLDKVEYELHEPGNPEKKIGLSITLAGNSHPAYMQFLEEEFRKLTKLQEEAERDTEAGKKAEKVQSLEELKLAHTKSVAARILGASAPVKFRGNVVTFGPANALEILMDPKFVWMVPQLREFGNNQENFNPFSAQK